jgi:hypothetical protein
MLSERRKRRLEGTRLRLRDTRSLNASHAKALPHIRARISSHQALIVATLGPYERVFSLVWTPHRYNV